MRKTILILFLMFCGIIRAQEGSLINKFEKKEFKSQSVLLPYRIYIPENYNPSKLYPLILCLHGAGERGIDNESHINIHGLATSWVSDSLQKENPVFVIAPQCPPNHKWVYSDWHLGTYNMDTINVGQELLAVIQLLDSIISQYSIDTNRQYVTGLSMGGYGTWDIITRYPNRFAAAIPMSGAADTSKVESLISTSIWSFHNANDKIVPVSGSREIMKALQIIEQNVVFTSNLKPNQIDDLIEAGVKYLYTESKHGNHGPWEPWYNSSSLHKWLFLQKK